jgi:multiple sugar transport system permease protein
MLPHRNTAIARAFRLILSLLAILIVGWSFFDVGRRIVVARHTLQARPIKLTVLHWGDQAEDGIVDRLTQKFMAEHPSVQIERINAGTEFESKLKTMMSAGTTPDVFYLRPDLFPEFAERHLIAPLDDRFDKEPEQWRSDFYPIVLNAFRYDSATKLVGDPKATLYGLPKDFTPTVFYVNLDLFKAAGVAVPYNGWTWDEFEADMKKITAWGKGQSSPVYGGCIQMWPDLLRDILWTYGGEFFGPGGFRDVTLDSPQSQAALQMFVRTRLIDRTVYNPTGVAKDGAEVFFGGNIGCIGPLGRWMSPRYSSITKFKWDVVPVPYKDKPASQLFYTAWTMSSNTKHPDEAYQLLKYLCGVEGQIDQAHLGLGVPCLKSVANSPDFLSPPGMPPINTRVFLDALQYSRLQQLPRETAEWSRIVNDKINNAIQLGQVSTMQAAADVRRGWLDVLDSPLRAKAWQPMRWNTILLFTAAVFVTLIFALWLRARQESLGAIDRAQARAGWTFIAPWLIGFLALTLGPMIASLLLSFSRWSAMVPMGAAESVGVANYRQLLSRDAMFWQSLRVTLYFVALAVPIGQVAALAIALLMNSKVRAIEFFRTVYFVPSVVSGVALAVLWLQVFNNDYGLLNKLINPVAGLFHTRAPDWFGQDAARWAIPAFVIMGLWGVGGGMIVYLAGLKGIPASLYEAATIDGAGRLRRLWNVTLPMLSPLIFYNLIMGIIASFQIFTQAKVMTDGQPDNTTLFYVLYLYRQAFEFHNMGYASAMAWVLFLMILALTVMIFAGSKRLVYYEGLKA